MNFQELLPITETIPASPYLFWILGIVTFAIHILLINIVFGGSVITLYNRLRNTPEEPEKSFHGPLPGKIPNLIALAINFGVAPLLFIQVIYGNLYYTSSVLLASFKIAIIPLLIVAYYCAYIYKIKYITRRDLSKYALITLIVVMLYIAFIFINNLTIMVTPHTWPNYFTNKTGTFLSLKDLTIYPRLFHFILASIAIGGLFTSLIWNFRKKRGLVDSDINISQGLRIFAYASIIQIIAGIWYLLSLPENMKYHFLGYNLIYTVIFIIGILCALASIVAAFLKRLMATTASLALTIAAMVSTRTNLRTLYTKEYFDLKNLQVVPQYDVLAVFLLFLIAGIVLIWYILKTGLGPITGGTSE